ncbi:hypothetical protein AB0K51_08340 [Kitasatospora sp. NPDC049285]|uniref:hypothetical protein n=1 Tax=Kitasatospora sp. NPDC049285 TaxID=3157096 RepID=UPI003424C9D4
MPGPVASGPYRPWVSALCAALPVLSLGLLGLVPSLVLAVGRRRRVDVVGAVVFGVLQLAVYVASGLTPRGEALNLVVVGVALIPLWLGAPVHFLLMNRRRHWPAAKTAYPFPVQPYPVPPYPTPPQAYPAQPYPGQPVQPTGAAELRELGELLRRQAGDGRP